MQSNFPENTEYRAWVKELKSKIQSSQIKVAISANTELLKLYWEIGESISKKIKSTDLGSRVVEKLSIDLKKEIPNQNGFSRSNLFSIKQWFEFYSSSNSKEKVQQLVGLFPWGHNIQPIGIAEYELSKAIPEDLKSSLDYYSLLVG
ncbi:MAG: DUF1016 N-terminal domain-containing protein [Bacteroidota bacterium]